MDGRLGLEVPRGSGRRGVELGYVVRWASVRVSDFFGEMGNRNK